MFLLLSTPPCLSDHGGLYPLKLSPDNLKVILTVMKKVSDASIKFRLFSVPM